jgi:cell division protein FtsN
MMTLSTQRGRTFLGFVIGALFGLAVALGVAVYITKAPIPFMSKNQPRPAEGEASESKKNRDWDPNAGLPGRMAPKPAADASAPAEGPAAAASAPATPAKAPDALADLIRSRSEAAKAPEAAPRPAPAPVPAAAPVPVPAPAAAEAAAADPFQYYVQVGAFRNAEEAEQQRAKLLLMGLQARVSEREQAGRMVYRVRLGPFDRRDDADKARERLDGAGSAAVVVRVQR